LVNNDYIYSDRSNSLTANYISEMPHSPRAKATGNIRSINFHPERIRSRKVVSRSNARPTGKYPSWKMGRMLQWESVNELNALRLLDCDPKVKFFYEQPCEIEFVQNGIFRSHFPDLLVECVSGKEMWEVKTQSDALKVDVSERTDLLKKVLPDWGYTYRLILADDLKRQPRLANANLLLKYGRKPVGLWDREEIRRELQVSESMSWSAACAGAYGKTGRENICRLVLEGILTFDAMLPIATAEFVPSKEGL
jgi:hypothetical protein